MRPVWMLKGTIWHYTAMQHKCCSRWAVMLRP